MKHVLLADQYAVNRYGIKMLLGENQVVDLNLVDEAGTEAEVIGLVRQKEYHLIVLDMQLPDAKFYQLLEWIRIESPASYVLVFTDNSEDMYGLRCMQLGARGFLTKGTSINEVIYAIKRIFHGNKYLSEHLSELLRNSRNSHCQSENPFHNLSHREMEIADLLEKGASLKDISSILSIEYSTVNTHKRRIFEKLNVNSLIQLSKLKQSFNKEITAKSESGNKKTSAVSECLLMEAHKS